MDTEIYGSNAFVSVSPPDLLQYGRQLNFKYRSILPSGMDGLEREQLELSDVCAALAEKMGLTYEPYTFKTDKKYGARFAIHHFSIDLAWQCGQNLYGARTKREPPLDSEAAKHLMSSPLDAAEKIFVSAYKYNHSHFLDLGCGSGFVVALGLKLGYDAYGVDIDPRIVNEARENLQRLDENPERIVLGDFFADEFWETPVDGRKPSSFDFYYLHNEWDIMSKAIPVIASKMQKGSHLIPSYIAPFVEISDSYLERKGLVREDSHVSIVWRKK
jgi:SAM-dependent methyltransferase